MDGLVINIDKLEQSKDSTALTLQDTTGVDTTTGYGATQLPVGTRDTTDISHSIVVLNYNDADYTFILDNASTPTAADFASQTKNLELTGANLGGTSTDKLDNGIFDLNYTVCFDDLKVADLSGTLSAAYNASTLSSTIPYGTYRLWIAALDGGGNLSNAINTGVDIFSTGTAVDAYLTFTGVSNAVGYRIFLKTGSTYYYKDTTSTTVTFASATSTTTNPSTLTTNNTKGYVKYIEADNAFETQGIIKTTYATMGYEYMNSLVMDDITYTISSLASTTKAVVSNPLGTTFVDGTYYRVYVSYYVQTKILLVGKATECLVSTIVKLPLPCCSDCEQEDFANAFKFYMIYLGVDSCFDQEIYTKAQTNIDWIDAVCSDTNPCGC